MRLLVIFLVLCCVSVWTASYTAQLTRIPSKKLQLLREGKFDELKKLKLSRGSRLTVGQQPLTDFYDSYYLVNVSLGTPSQSIPVQFDTLTSDLWVIDGSKYPDSTKVVFYEDQSSTFAVKDNTSHYESNPFYGFLYYYVGNDRLRLGDLQVSKQDILLATYMTGQYFNEGQPENGVLGLGINTDLSPNRTSPISNLLRQLDQELFTVWYDKMVNLTHIGNGGLVTFGAVDTTNCDSQWNYAPLINPDYSSWRWGINYYSMGTSKFPSKYQVIVGTSSHFTMVPDLVLRNILWITGAKFNSDYNMYLLPCDSSKTLPDLVLNAYGGPSQPAQSFNLNIPASSYVVDIGNHHGMCALAFQSTTGFEGDNTIWILGDTFIRNYCNLFDYGNKRMGFSKPKQLM